MKSHAYKILTILWVSLLMVACSLDMSEYAMSSSKSKRGIRKSDSIYRNSRRPGNAYSDVLIEENGLYVSGKGQGVGGMGSLIGGRGTLGTLGSKGATPMDDAYDNVEEEDLELELQREAKLKEALLPSQPAPGQASLKSMAYGDRIKDLKQDKAAIKDSFNAYAVRSTPATSPPLPPPQIVSGKKRQHNQRKRLEVRQNTQLQYLISEDTDPIYDYAQSHLEGRLELGSKQLFDGSISTQPAEVSAIDQYLLRGKPDRFWPKQGYFKNTYLGGDLGYREKLQSTSTQFKVIMSHRDGYAWSPPLDPPLDGGMNVSAKLSHSFIDRPQRVILQVALKGSERYGWRRPALNLMVMIDPSLLADIKDVEWRHTQVVEMLKPILRRLNAADQVGLVCGDLMITPRSPELLKAALLTPLSFGHNKANGVGWKDILSQAGQRLNHASSDPYRAPGTQTIMMICGSGCRQSTPVIRQAVHELNLEGTLTSVIDHSGYSSSSSSSKLWQIAAAGHGGFWITEGDQGLGKALNAEFDRFSRVVARLLRLSIKLSEGVELIEVMGSEMLTQSQVTRVKAREKAMDQRLSARLGIESDRGKDDEGVQVVIPAFYGGDSHLVHLALWVNKSGQLAEVQLKYKDMVSAQNASYASSVDIGYVPQALTQAQQEVRQGAKHHLIAAQSLKALRAGRDIQSLPSTLELVNQGLQRQYISSKEIELLSRAHLGRPYRK